MKKELGLIHIAVLLFGLSGLFAKWIPLSAHIIVFGRVFFAALFLLMVLLLLKKSIILPTKRSYLPFIVIGGVLALHWGSFFHAIQISSVAVGLVTFATFPVFASLLEPIVFKESYEKRSFVIAACALIGVIFIVPEFDFSNNVTKGAIWGLISAITFAVLSILNRTFVRDFSSIMIGFYQNSFAFIWLIPLVLFFEPVKITVTDVSLLITLGIVFTGIAHVTFIQGLSKVNVRTASIIATLEPVYGILAAAVLLQEIPDMREWIGMIIILSAATYISLKRI
ncbi:DMT family transporter [Evansella tamaricis]|uniref:EamA family transporter n=1 Tax=Evansella tamaricis TaxID=2069301 RepID=A0ABS6JHL0_9BACI|nr:EamA family transporter [Evansella tamaricis]MBU9713164.1 EamA family transporter [Evansella tamaricis]